MMVGPGPCRLWAARWRLLAAVTAAEPICDFCLACQCGARFADVFALVREMLETGHLLCVSESGFQMLMAGLGGVSAELGAGLE